MKIVKLAFGNFLKQATQRDHRLVFFTQAVLTFFLVTLTLTSASIQTYLQTNMESLLGSDMVISQYQPLTPLEQTAINEFSDLVSETSVVPINLTHNQQWRRVQLKLVDHHYPVQGQLKKSLTRGGPSETTGAIPQLGYIWVDTRLAANLGLGIGDKVKIGGTELMVSAFLLHEPDRLMEGHSVEMRALVASNSLPNSFSENNAQYRYLIVAEKEQRSLISDWAKQSLPEARVMNRHEGRHPLAAYWQRVENFLGLVSVLLFFMAAIAIHLASRRIVERLKQRLALFVSLGAPMAQNIRMAFYEWLIGFTLAFLPALLLAYGAQFLLMIELKSQFPGISAGVHLQEVIYTSALVLALMFFTQLPMFIQLTQTSVLSLIRQQSNSRFTFIHVMGAAIMLTGLAIAYSDNGLLTAMTLSALGVAVLFILVSTWLVLALGDLWGRKRAGLLPFVFFIMKQRLFSKAVQVLGLGLCVTLMLFTLMLMKDIGAAMESQTRAANGNLMITDALDPQVDDIEVWADKTGSEIRELNAFTHAQVVKINGVLLGDLDKQPSESLARLERPIRLSWANEIPENNRVNSGEWWSESDRDWQQVSVEDEVMTDLNLSLGDQLTLVVSGKPYDFTLVASHVFKPGGSSMTFWFQIPELGARAMNADIHHMGSMELPESAWNQLGELLSQHPTLSVLSLQEITERFDRTLAIVTKMALGFSAVILLLSMVVIVASVSGYEADDRKRLGLLRSLGLPSGLGLRLVISEWLFTGVIAAGGAIVGTWVAGQLIYSSQFSLVYQPDYLWTFITLTSTCLLLCVVGIYFSRGSLKASVRDLMAE